MPVVYRYIDRRLSASLATQIPQISPALFVYVGYVLLECFRGYALMMVVHEWLILDSDVWLGLAVGWAALFWPPGIPASDRSLPFWPHIGVFLYVLPGYTWVFPLTFGLIFAIGGGPILCYGMAIIAVLGAAIYSGSNSLYVLLYIELIVFLIIKYFNSGKIQWKKNWPKRYSH